MKAIIIAIMMLVFAASVSAIAQINPPAAVSGFVYYTNGTGVLGASVDVTCQHNLVNTTLGTTSIADGSYLQVFDPSQCTFGDMVWVNAMKGNMAGSNDGQTCTQQQCEFPVALVDVTIPEFGVIAGFLALVGTLAIFVIVRNK